MKTANDAPCHLNAAEASAWLSGFDAAIEECARIAMERGGADGIIIAAKIRALSETAN